MATHQAATALLEPTAYQYNAGMLSCAQQVQLYQQLMHHQLLAWQAAPGASIARPTLSSASSSSCYGAPFAMPPSPSPWAQCSPYGAALQWGAMPAWPQMGAQQAAPCMPLSSLALSPLSHEALASVHASATSSPCCGGQGAPAKAAAAMMTSSSNNNNFNATCPPASALLGSTGAEQVASASEAAKQAACGAVVPAVAPVAVADDEDICDDLFRMFADDGDHVEVPEGAKPSAAGVKDASAVGLSSSLVSNDDSTVANNQCFFAPQQQQAPALPQVALHAAAGPYGPYGHMAAMPTTSASATSMMPFISSPPPPAHMAFPGAHYLHNVAHYGAMGMGMGMGHLASPPSAAAPYTSTVFSAAQAIAASRPSTPPVTATTAAAGATTVMPRAGSMPTPTSSNSNTHIKATSGGAGAGKGLGVHGGGVAKPSSPTTSSALRAPMGRQPSSTSSSLGRAATAGLLDGELLAGLPARAKSPLGAAAVAAAPAEQEQQEEDLAGSCSAAGSPEAPHTEHQQAEQQQQQLQAAEEEANLLLCGAAADALLDCDNLSHTLDWMDGLV